MFGIKSQARLDRVEALLLARTEILRSTNGVICTEMGKLKKEIGQLERQIQRLDEVNLKLLECLNGAPPAPASAQIVEDFNRLKDFLGVELKSEPAKEYYVKKEVKCD